MSIITELPSLILCSHSLLFVQISMLIFIFYMTCFFSFHYIFQIKCQRNTDTTLQVNASLHDSAANTVQRSPGQTEAGTGEPGHMAVCQTTPAT